jgi:hypothetical protein
VPRDRLEVGYPLRVHSGVTGCGGRLQQRLGWLSRRGPGPAGLDLGSTTGAITGHGHRRRREETVTGRAPRHDPISAGRRLHHGARGAFTDPLPVLAVARSRSSTLPVDTMGTARGTRCPPSGVNCVTLLPGSSSRSRSSAPRDRAARQSHDHPLRRRTRSLIGVGPRSNASRMRRSR